MAISFESHEASDTLSEWRVCRNILDPIKYSGNQVWRFLDPGMGMENRRDVKINLFMKSHHNNSYYYYTINYFNIYAFLKQFI